MYLLTECFDSLSKKKGKDQESIQKAPQLTQDTNGKVTTWKLDITNESQEVGLFPAGDHNKVCIVCKDQGNWYLILKFSSSALQTMQASSGA